MRAIHDDTPDRLEVITPSSTNEATVSDLLKVKSDPFARPVDDIRKLEGLGANTKRQLTRKINKLADGSGETPNVYGRDGAKTKARTDKFATGYGAFDVVEPEYNPNYLAKLYEISPAHMASVDAKVTNIVGLGYMLVESELTQDRISNLDDEEQLKRARTRIGRAKRQLREWMETLNSEESFVETLRKVWTDVETIGNGYIEVGRDIEGRVGYVGHINGTTIRRRVQKDGYVQIVAGRARFFRNYGETVVDPIGDDDKPNEIIHFMKYTPTSDYYGIPNIISAKNAVAGQEFADRFNLDFFEHKAVPRYIAILKNANISREEQQKLVDFLQNNLKGQHHRTVLIPLPADNENKQVEFKLEAVDAKINDASFTKYHESNIDDILMSHRVPRPQVGMTSQMSLGVARDAARFFKEQVCRPWQDIIETRLRPLLREKTNAFNIHLNELTLTDEDTASRIHERYLRWEVLTPNEVREWLDRKGRSGGDETVGVMSQAKERQAKDREASQSRTRDAERSGGPDTPESDKTRAPKGEGRQTP